MEQNEHRETATLSSKRDGARFERAVRLLRSTTCEVCQRPAAEIRISRSNDVATISGLCAAHQTPINTTSGRRLQLDIADRANHSEENASA